MASSKSPDRKFRDLADRLPFSGSLSRYIRTLDEYPGESALGNVIISPDRAHCYVPIPKCGTNSLHATFPDWRSEDHKTGVDIDGFAIVRHPVDRWHSGIKEATFHHDPDRDYDTMLDAARTGRFQWDNHTRPQADFLRNFDVELVKLEHAADYVLERFGRKLAWERRREWEPAPDLVPAILEYYADDLILYESAL